MLSPFLVLDAVFVVALTWVLWTGLLRRKSGQRRARPADAPASLRDAARPLPAPTPPPVTRILFAGNSAAPSPTAIAELDALAAWMKTHDARLELEGSADDTGHLTQNRRLARARAALAQRALLAHGIASDRLVVLAAEPGRGATERERQALRCVRFRLV